MKGKNLKSSGNKITLADRIHACMDIDEAVTFIAAVRVNRKQMTEKPPESEVETSLSGEIDVNEDNLGLDDDIISKTGQGILIKDV